MPTLSFSCPKCNALHQRVRTEMVGYKVRCRCGYVFRLGDKSDKQAWVVDDLKRKKAEKLARRSTVVAQLANHPTPNRAEVVPLNENECLGESASNLEDSIGEIDLGFSLREPTHAGLDHAGPVSSGSGANHDSSLSGNEEFSRSGSRSDARFSSILETEMSSVDPVSRDISVSRGSVQQALPANQPYQSSLIGRRPESVTADRKRLNAGAVWCVVMSLLTLPFLVAQTLIMIGRSIRMMQSISPTSAELEGVEPLISLGVGTVDVVVPVILACFLAMTFFASVLMGGVSAFELFGGTTKRWAFKFAAVLAALTLFVVFLVFAFQVYRLVTVTDGLEQLGQELGARIERASVLPSLAVLALNALLYAVIPLAITITGMVRGRAKTERTNFQPTRTL